MAMSKIKKAFLIIVSIMLAGLILFGYIYFHVPFSDSGVKAGVLNNVKHKGYIFKTYEGELIQIGFSHGKKGLQSNEFLFSVEDEAVAKRLMNLAGQEVKLHYKEYFGALPWRGHSKFVVDSIVEVVESNLDLMPNVNDEPPVDELIGV